MPYEHLSKDRFIRGRRTVWLRRDQIVEQQGREKGVYHATAAALRVKDSVMGTVTSVQENAADILASAKDINEQRAAQEETVEDTSKEAAEA